MPSAPDITPHAAPGDEALPAAALALLQASGLIVGIFDEHDILRFANPGFIDAYHVRPDGHSTWVDLMRGNYQRQRGTAVEAPDFEAWLASARSRRGKKPFRAFESNNHDGRWIWMTETTLDNGWMLCVASDITALNEDGRSLRQTRDQALRAAQTDALTGISNRKHMTQQLDQLLAQAQLRPWHDATGQRHVGDQLSLLGDTFRWADAPQLFNEVALLEQHGQFISSALLRNLVEYGRLQRLWRDEGRTEGLRYKALFVYSLARALRRGDAELYRWADEIIRSLHGTAESMSLQHIGVIASYLLLTRREE